MGHYRELTSWTSNKNTLCPTFRRSMRQVVFYPSDNDDRSDYWPDLKFTLGLINPAWSNSSISIKKVVTTVLKNICSPIKPNLMTLVIVRTDSGAPRHSQSLHVYVCGVWFHKTIFTQPFVFPPLSLSPPYLYENFFYIFL